MIERLVCVMMISRVISGQKIKTEQMMMNTISQRAGSLCERKLLGGGKLEESVELGRIVVPKCLSAALGTVTGIEPIIEG